MNKEAVLGSSMMIKMKEALVEQGWQFTLNERNIITHANHTKTGELIKFPSFGHLRIWFYSHALNRQ